MERSLPADMLLPVNLRLTGSNGSSASETYTSSTVCSACGTAVFTLLVLCSDLLDCAAVAPPVSWFALSRNDM